MSTSRVSFEQQHFGCLSRFLTGERQVKQNRKDERIGWVTECVLRFLRKTTVNQRSVTTSVKCSVHLSETGKNALSWTSRPGSPTFPKACASDAVSAST